MPRRDLHLRADLGWDFWNLVSTIGAFIIAFSILIFIFNVFDHPQVGQVAARTPWDGAHARVVDPVAAAGLQLRAWCRPCTAA